LERARAKPSGPSGGSRIKSISPGGGQKVAPIMKEPRIPKGRAAAVTLNARRRAGFGREDWPSGLHSFAPASAGAI
jgi:hypothetical protein